MDALELFEVDAVLAAVGFKRLADRPRDRNDLIGLAGSADWDGLDTTIDAHTHSPYVEVVALDDHGHAIGRAQAVQVSD